MHFVLWDSECSQNETKTSCEPGSRIRTVALSLATPGSTVGRPCSGSTGASSAPPAGEEVGEVEEEEEELLQGPACAKKPKQ